MMDSFIPQEELRDEISESCTAGEVPLPDIKQSSELPSEFDDNENAEIQKICNDDNSDLQDPAQPIISLTPSPSTDASKLESMSSPDSKQSLSPARTPTKTSPKTPRKIKSASPKTTKRVFSPEDHKNRVSQFKLREIEKKKALDERRKKQAEELEKKRIAIMKKHEAADRRLQQRSRASPVKSGAFGSTVRSRSSMSLNISTDKQKTGSVQNLVSPKVQMRPQSTGPRLKRPVSMGALPTSGPVHTASFRKSITPVPRSTKGPVSQPVIRQTKREDEKKSSMKKKVDLKNLLKPTKVSNFTPTGRKTPEDTSKPTTKPQRTSSIKRTSAKSPANHSKPVTAPPKTSAPKQRRSSAGKLDVKQQTPVESPTKSVMNSSMQAKVNQQEEAKLRLEEARKKAREERAKKEEEERRLAEERRIEEEKKRAEAEEARQRMLKEKELRKKQIEEEAERARIAEQEQAEQQQKEEEERQRADQERQEQQQREELELFEIQRRKAEEERMAQEEERRERQKKLDAILKRSSVKVDTAPKREISANASAILAKHNITLNLPSVAKQEETKPEIVSASSVDSSDSASNEQNDTETTNSNEPSSLNEEEIDETSPDVTNEPSISAPENVNGQNENDNLLIDVSDGTNDFVSESQPNNHNAIEELNSFNGESRLSQDQDLLVMLSDDKLRNNDFIESNSDALSTKEANEFTIGITSPEELQLSNVL